MNKILAKVSKFLRKTSFERVLARIRSTPPLVYEARDDIVIVSQIFHGAVNMYLLAIKSFMSSFGVGRVEVIDDGSLTEDDKQIISQHVPGIKIIPISSINVGRCPTGGTWERLVHILNLAENSYVIQVDSDTYTVAGVPEVFKAYRENSAFTIGGPIWPEPVTAEYISRIAGQWDSDHVQVHAERQIMNINEVSGLLYCRGCSAFAGFSKGGRSFEFLEEVSGRFESRLGREKWSEWGSEQFSSNIMISASNNPLILPWPKYQNFGFPFLAGPSSCHIQAGMEGKVSFIHFIENNRYAAGVYEKRCREFLKSKLMS